MEFRDSQTIMLIVDGTARVRSAVAPLNGEARLSSPQTSQLVAGQVVQLLENTGDWWKVRGPDAYDGWLHVGYIEPSTGNESTWRLSLGVTVRTTDGVVRALPFSARVSDDAEVVGGHAIAAAAMTMRFPRNPAAVIETAVTFFSGASYLWGGVTPWGCDCSGLVQTLFALHGHMLPRDAWQQAEIGDELSVTALHASNTLQHFQPGDLLFFSDRGDKRITHVGLAMSNHQFIHSGVRRGGVRVEDLGSDELYVQQLRANFVCARRLSL